MALPPGTCSRIARRQRNSYLSLLLLMNHTAVLLFSTPIALGRVLSRGPYDRKDQD